VDGGSRPEGLKVWFLRREQLASFPPAMGLRSAAVLLPQSSNGVRGEAPAAVDFEGFEFGTPQNVS